MGQIRFLLLFCLVRGSVEAEEAEVCQNRGSLLGGGPYGKSFSFNKHPIYSHSIVIPDFKTVFGFFLAPLEVVAVKSDFSKKNTLKIH